MLLRRSAVNNRARSCGRLRQFPERSQMLSSDLRYRVLRCSVVSTAQ